MPALLLTISPTVHSQLSIWNTRAPAHASSSGLAPVWQTGMGLESSTVQANDWEPAYTCA